VNASRRDVRFVDRLTHKAATGSIMSDMIAHRIYGNTIIIPEAVIPLRKSAACAAQLCGCLNPLHYILPTKL
jgi:hypothetical protein